MNPSFTRRYIRLAKDFDNPLMGRAQSKLKNKHEMRKHFLRICLANEKHRRWSVVMNMRRVCAEMPFTPSMAIMLEISAVFEWFNIIFSKIRWWHCTQMSPDRWTQWNEEKRHDASSNCRIGGEKWLKLQFGRAKFCQLRVGMTKRKSDEEIARRWFYADQCTRQ